MVAKTANVTKAVVVLSGGQDSTTCLFHAKSLFDEVHAVTFDYGQKHVIELWAARNVAKLAGVLSHEVITLPAGILKSTSPLVDKQEQLEVYADHASMEAIIGDRVEKTFVPMRNALFLTIAANRAVDLGASTVVTGVCEEDNANYPDCRLDFLTAQQDAINEALGARVIRIYAPLLSRTKAETVRMAHLMDSEKRLAWYALAFTHTAYDGLYPPTGKDHASVLRAEGFLRAGLPDPLVVRAVYEGLMPLPDSPNYANVDVEGMGHAIAAIKKSYGLEA